MEAAMENLTASHKKQLILWHGTNQDFSQFDNAMKGLHTYNSASNQAFFFAVSPETARDYARSAARKLIQNLREHEETLQSMLDEAERALQNRNFDKYEQIILKAEEFEASAVQAEPAGAVLLQCRLTCTNPLEVRATSRDVIANFGGVLSDAREAGYDAVIVRNIMDTPSGTGPVDDHVAVFDAAQIEIIDVISAEADTTLPNGIIPENIFDPADPFHCEPGDEEVGMEPAFG
jgi:hypothetical protein